MTDDIRPDSTMDGVRRDGSDDAGDLITADDLTFTAADGEADVIDHAGALAAVQAAFAGLAGSEEVDILPTEGEDNDDIAVAGDAWTLYLSGWPGPATAFVAVEDEPADDAEAAAVEAAWRSVVSGDAVAAMSMIDIELEGALTHALDASGDPLSQSIATAVRLGAVAG